MYGTRRSINPLKDGAAQYQILFVNAAWGLESVAQADWQGPGLTRWQVVSGGSGVSPAAKLATFIGCEKDSALGAFY